MMELLIDGLRESSDYAILQKPYVLKQVLSLHGSPLSNTRYDVRKATLLLRHHF